MRKKIQIIKSKTDADCMVACLAMLLGVNYAVALSFIPVVNVMRGGIGYEFKLLLQTLYEHGIELCRAHTPITGEPVRWGIFRNNK